MCRYTLSTQRFVLLEERLHTAFPDLTPRNNIAPSQEVPVIRKVEEGYAVVGQTRFWNINLILPHSPLRTKARSTRRRTCLWTYAVRSCVSPTAS
jgi:putative SOS response-associated peptidase YedK